MNFIAWTSCLTQKRGRVSKIPKHLQTSFKYGPQAVISFVPTEISPMFTHKVFIDRSIAVFVDDADGRGRTLRCQNLVHACACAHPPNAGGNLSRSCCLPSPLSLYSPRPCCFPGLSSERSPFTTPPLLGAHAAAASSSPSSLLSFLEPPR